MATLDDGLQRDAIRQAAKSIYESLNDLPWEEVSRQVRAKHYFIAKDALLAAIPLMALSNEQEIHELRRCVAGIETQDMGGYTQRDAYEIADTLYDAGYRRLI